MTVGHWAEETCNDVITRYRVQRIVYHDQSDFQDILIVESKPYGLMLLLDHMVQTTEKDEFVYHEMLTHVPMLMHPHPKKVLVIGGGDGGILREVLRHPTVTSAVLVEIDPGVIEACRKYMPMISQGSLDDPRSTIVIRDAAEYVADTDDRFDVIIVDSPDPIGPARVLAARPFYEGLVRCLKPDGTLSRQTGIAFDACTDLVEAWSHAHPLFARAAPYLFTVPTYVGGPFSALLCAHNTALPGLLETVAERFHTAGLQTRYYSPAIHPAAFQLPPYVRTLLA